VQSRPRPWPPAWLAIYQTSVFGPEKYTVRYYGHVKRIERKPRAELFPGETPNPKSGRVYYQLHLDRLERLPQPIVSPRPRRNPFIPTTWRKFSEAGQINDVFDDSPLEDRLWEEFKLRQIPAERQWRVDVDDACFYLDFALYCNKGQIDVETDGTTWHTNRSKEDNARNNALTTLDWSILRFDTEQIQEQAATYCISEVTRTINRLGGLLQEAWAPRRFYESPDGPVQQLGLFEEPPDYDLDLD
jgi:very-short-patch-repair endonuclease